MASGKVPTDEELVRRTLAGEDDAFDEIVSRYKGRIYNLAYQMCHERDLADDWAQEAFVRAYEQIARFDTDRTFAPWLFTVSTHVFLNQARRHSPAVVSLDEGYEEGGEMRQVADTAPGPELAIQRLELSEAVQKAIRQLPDPYRMTILLRHVEELEYNEISEAMKIPIGTVKTYLHRGRERLRQILEPLLREQEK
jgi:RNA polymerase sigma-70 factor, ECF subfamily